MSELTLWVCGTPSGQKEIIRTYGGRPNNALCVSPLDNMNLITLNWYYSKPGTGERVDLQGYDDIPPSYYLDYTTNEFITPVPDPIPRFWRDGAIWKPEPGQEGLLQYYVVTPRQEVEAVINEVAKSEFDAQKLISNRQREIENLINSIQRMLDTKAQEKGYDSALSCVSYAGSSIANFNTEALAMRTWRSNVWAWGYSQLENVGQGDLPSAETLISTILGQYPAPW